MKLAFSWVKEVNDLIRKDMNGEERLGEKGNWILCGIRGLTGRLKYHVGEQLFSQFFLSNIQT